MRRNALRPTHRDAVEYISYDYAALIAPTTPANLRPNAHPSPTALTH